MPELTGKAHRLFNSLDWPDDYDFVKESILNAHAITPDGNQQKLQSITKGFTQTSAEYTHELLRIFKKWLEATNTKTLKEIINLLVLEEFTSKQPFPILR